MENGCSQRENERGRKGSLTVTTGWREERNERSGSDHPPPPLSTEARPSRRQGGRETECEKRGREAGRADRCGAGMDRDLTISGSNTSSWDSKSDCRLGRRIPSCYRRRRDRFMTRRREAVLICRPRLAPPFDGEAPGKSTSLCRLPPPASVPGR